MVLSKSENREYLATRFFQITKEDFYKFDWIFGMSSDIVYDLYQMQPLDSHAKIELLGKYDPDGTPNIRDPLFVNISYTYLS